MSGKGPQPVKAFAGEDITPARVALDTAHSVFIESTTLLWIVYRHTLSSAVGAMLVCNEPSSQVVALPSRIALFFQVAFYGAGPARLLIPEHTRNAFFQAFCDLRTNSPKDRYALDHCLSNVGRQDHSSFLPADRRSILVN